MSKNAPDSDDRQPPASRLRFLFVAGAFLLFAVLDYLVMDSMQYVGVSALLSATHTLLAFLLLVFVVAALVCLACYGNRRLAKAVDRRVQYLKDAWGVPMRYLGLGGFRVESASDEARMASRRIHHRHDRRRYARQHRNRDA